MKEDRTKKSAESNPSSSPASGPREEKSELLKRMKKIDPEQAKKYRQCSGQ